jgi:transposase
VMPRTWKEDGQFREQVRRGKIEWKHILSRKNNRKPYSKVDHYFVAEGEYQTSYGYRLHWIRSTQKAEQDLETRMRRLEQALEELRALQPKLNRYKLKRRQQIQQRIQDILKNRHCQTLVPYEIHTTREYQRLHPQKGRPTPGTAAQITWRPIFSISFGINKDALREAEKTDGVFPLITNLDEKTYRPQKILEIYKFQPFLEKRNSQIKTYQEIAPVYLKNGKRVVAFLHIHVMALMVATLIERKLRHAMKSRGISSLPLYPENRPCKTPTMFDIVRLFTGVERYEVYEGDKITVFPAALTKTQKLILTLLEVPLAHYQ